MNHRSRSECSFKEEDKMWAALSLLFVALCSNCVFTSPLKTGQAGENLVSKDEVNILMYGVLQFGESLHHMYQSTEARLARVMTAVSRTESEVKKLGHDTEAATQTKQQIKEKLQLIQAQMKVLQIQIQENRSKVSRVEMEEAQLKKKLCSMEENLNSSVSDTIKGKPQKHIKNISILEELMKWTREQKLKLENQNQQLSHLQKLNMV